MTQMIEGMPQMEAEIQSTVQTKTTNNKLKQQTSTKLSLKAVSELKVERIINTFRISKAKDICGIDSVFLKT